MNGHRFSSNSLDDLPLLVAIHTKSHKLPYNSCWNVRILQNLPPNTNHITCPLILITSPAAILNLPINLSYSVDTALVLTTDNFHLIFPPTPHPSLLPVLQPPGGTFQNHSHGRNFDCTFTYIYSFLIKKGICDRRNISSFHVFVCTFVWRSLHFLVSFLFLSLFTELSVLWYFPFHMDM